ncbi:hypothetical protein C2E23DRAFT_736374 [Lenzites betulinus]|nr:hypothetical protein C2E23DRAFT_736374 [Lenzites betulinus]
MGFFFDWALQGILCVQIYMYHLLFPHDSRAMKGFVYGVFVYEWIQTILITQTAFEIDVYGFGDRVSLTSFHNTWFSVTIMCAILSAAVQGYFCWRIWAFSCSKMLAGTIMFFAFSQMCAGVAGGIMLHTVSPNAARFSADTPLLTAWLVCAALVDVAIAACMSYYLLRAKSGLKASDDLVNRLVRFIIETGTLTATVAIFDAIAFTVIPNTLVYECPALVLAKVYANTLLASLNNRAIMRRFDPNDGTVCLDLRGMLVGSNGGPSGVVFSPGRFSEAAHRADHSQMSSEQQGNRMRLGFVHEEYVFGDMQDSVVQLDARGSVVGEVKGAEMLELANANANRLPGSREDNKACI